MQVAQTCYYNKHRSQNNKQIAKTLNKKLTNLKEFRYLNNNKMKIEYNFYLNLPSGNSNSPKSQILVAARNIVNLLREPFHKTANPARTTNRR